MSDTKEQSLIAYVFRINERLGEIAIAANEVNYPLGYIFADWDNSDGEFVIINRPGKLLARFTFNKIGKKAVDQYLDTLFAEVEEYREVIRHQKEDEEQELAMEKASEFEEKHDLFATWSIYDKTNFNELAGTGKIVVKYDGGWGKACQIEVDSPTWGDMYIAADQLIRLSGDHHHMFIEDFDLINNDYHLRTGS